MTVINAMRFNAREYGMVTDSQSSTPQRKYNIADKVRAITTKNGTLVLIGGTGASDLLCETVSELERATTNQEVSVRQLAKTLSQVTIAIKREKMDNYLKSTFGIDTKKALAGDGIGQHLIQSVGEYLTGQHKCLQELLSAGFLLIGKDSEGVRLYYVAFGMSEQLSPQPYLSIGSGSDESDKVLYSYVNSLKREQQNDIPFLDGMAALIRATNASSDINQGVGGVPTINYFGNQMIVVLTEDKSKLATEIVRVRDGRMTRKQDYESSLKGLLDGTMSLDDAEKIAFSKDNPVKYDQIMRLLRGYKE